MITDIYAITKKKKKIKIFTRLKKRCEKQNVGSKWMDPLMHLSVNDYVQVMMTEVLVLLNFNKINLSYIISYFQFWF